MVERHPAADRISQLVCEARRVIPPLELVSQPIEQGSSVSRVLVSLQSVADPLAQLGCRTHSRSSRGDEAEQLTPCRHHIVEYRFQRLGFLAWDLPWGRQRAFISSCHDLTTNLHLEIALGGVLQCHRTPVGGDQGGVEPVGEIGGVAHRCRQRDDLCVRPNVAHPRQIDFERRPTARIVDQVHLIGDHYADPFEQVIAVAQHRVEFL